MQKLRGRRRLAAGVVAGVVAVGGLLLSASPVQAGTGDESQGQSNALRPARSRACGRLVQGGPRTAGIRLG